jgi:hypothetical protein
MKNFVWLAGLLLLASFLLPAAQRAVPAPVPVVVPVAPLVTDGQIVTLLAAADPADKRRINGVYAALSKVLQRDNGKRITTTEKWAEVAANTLQLAIDTPGKYPGLDVAIEAVFLAQVGTDDVLPNNPDTCKKLVAACDIVANSAAR